MKTLQLVVYSLYYTISKNQRESGAYGTAVLMIIVFQCFILIALLVIIEILLQVNFIDYINKIHVTIVLAIFWITNHAYFNRYVNKGTLIAKFDHLEWKIVKQISFGYIFTIIIMLIVIGVLANYRDKII